MTTEKAIELQGIWECEGFNKVSIDVVTNYIIFQGFYENNTGNSHLEVIGFAEISHQEDNILTIKWGDTNKSKYISDPICKKYIQTTIVEYNDETKNFNIIYSSYDNGKFGEFINQKNN